MGGAAQFLYVAVGKGPAHLLQQAWTFFQHQAGQFAQGLFLTAHTFQGIRPDQRRIVGCCGDPNISGWYGRNWPCCRYSS